MILFPVTRLLWQAARTIRQQNEIICRLQHERESVELAYMRISRDMIEQFLIALDHPEDQDPIRRRLACNLTFVRDEIAVREEHI